MENIDPNQARRVWSRVMAQPAMAEESLGDTPKERTSAKPSAAAAGDDFAKKVLLAIGAQKEDAALYHHLMRRCGAMQGGGFKTLIEHTQSRIKTLGAIYYLLTDQKACPDCEKPVCIACANEALRQQYERISAQIDAFRALAGEKEAYSCEMEQLAGMLCADKKCILEILKESL